MSFIIFFWFFSYSSSFWSTLLSAYRSKRKRNGVKVALKLFCCFSSSFSSLFWLFTTTFRAFVRDHLSVVSKTLARYCQADIEASTTFSKHYSTGQDQPFPLNIHKTEDLIWRLRGQNLIFYLVFSEGPKVLCESESHSINGLSQLERKPLVWRAEVKRVIDNSE